MPTRRIPISEEEFSRAVEKVICEDKTELPFHAIRRELQKLGIDCSKQELASSLTALIQEKRVILVCSDERANTEPYFIIPAHTSRKSDVGHLEH